MVQKADIESFLHAAKGHLIIDVRSPGEYEHAHIPGAINLPLFSNDERAAIGRHVHDAAPMPQDAQPPDDSHPMVSPSSRCFCCLSRLVGEPAGPRFHFLARLANRHLSWRCFDDHAAGAGVGGLALQWLAHAAPGTRRDASRAPHAAG